MLQIHLNIIAPKPSIIQTPERVVGVGSRVAVNTLCCGGQIGVIESIGISPYYAEECQRILRAYVVGDGWTDYLLYEEVLLEDEADFCLQCKQYFPINDICPDCGCCPGCCGCNTPPESDEDDDYHPPRFLWMGKWFPGDSRD